MSSADRNQSKGSSNFSQLTKAKPQLKTSQSSFSPFVNMLTKRKERKRGIGASGLEQLHSLHSSLESSEPMSSSSQMEGACHDQQLP
jgi:hypothetical protein